MRVLSIVSPGNDSGKTSLVAALCAAFPGRFTAVKGTTIHPEEEGRCPRSEEVECACRSLEGDFAILTDPVIVAQPGTDTGRIAAAGARRVLWAIGRPETYAALAAALRREFVRDDEIVVTEGNTLAARLSPEIRLFVANPHVPWDSFKSATESLCEEADLLVLNPFPLRRAEASPSEIERTCERLIRARAGRPWVYADLSRPLGPENGAGALALVRDRFLRGV